MKLIMENWKRFLSENKKEDIRNLKYGELKKRSHTSALSKELKVIDIKLSDIPIAKFPANDSEAVRSELKKVLDTMTNNRELSRKELNDTDRRPLKLFKDYLKKNDLDFDSQLIKDIHDDATTFAIKLKMRYERPRPEQLGPMVGYDIKSIKTDTDDTPAFPSGHTMVAWTLAYYLADKHPENKQEIYDIAEMIEKSRIIRGAHYPSDNKEAKKIAKKYLFPNIKD